MKKTCSLLLCCLLLSVAFVAMAEAPATEPGAVTLSEIGLATVFPKGWIVVTPDTGAGELSGLSASAQEVDLEAIFTEGVYAAAIASAGDAVLRVIAHAGDDVQALYADIDRYTQDMRTEMKDAFLANEGWRDLGIRYTEATWTNKGGQGRVLWLTYQLRDGDTVLARGRKAFTVRNKLSITLDIRAEGRRLSDEELRAFDVFVGATTFPVSQDLAPLPVGLSVTGGMPEDTYKGELTFKGRTKRGALVTGWLQGADGETTPLDKDTADAEGAFSIAITLPEPGEYQVFLTATLEGYAESLVGSFITYDETKLPITFEKLPSGDTRDAKVIVSGKTIAGVKITLTEGETIKRLVTESGGAFSFTVDRAKTGERYITLTFEKQGFNTRTVETTFNRQWQMDDYALFLAETAQTVSFKNLLLSPEKYIGRLVGFEGEVYDVSQAQGRHYVQLALRTDKNGAWTEAIVGVLMDQEILLAPGDRAAIYGEVSAETFSFIQVTEEGDPITMALPSLSLMAYIKK